MSLSLLGPLAAFASSLTWTLGSIVYSKMTEKHPPYAINFMRALCAFPICFAIMYFENGAGLLSFLGSLSLETWGWLFISTIASYGFGDFLFFWSAGAIGVPSALAIASSYPLWSALAGWLFQNQALSQLSMLGLFLVVSGVVTVILSGRAKSNESGESSSNLIQTTATSSNPTKKPWMKRYWSGVFFGFAVSIAWSLNTYAISRGGQGISIATTTGIRMGMALPFCFLMSFIFASRGSRGRVLIPWKDFKRPFPAFVIEAYGGSSLFGYGLVNAPLAVASALAGLAPVLSMPVSIYLGREKFSVLRLAGVIIVTLGAWLLVSG
jgi:drug/metabolite transporter (DMT)-like permease